MPRTPTTDGEWPEGGEGVIITFPNARSETLRSYVIEQVPEPRPHLLLAAPLLDGEVTVAAKGEAIEMQWRSHEVTHTLAGTVDGFVDSAIAAWRVTVGEGPGVKAVTRVAPASRVEPAGRVEAAGEVAPPEMVNRRRHVRVLVRRRVDLIVAGRKSTVETVDISESGVRCHWRGDPFWAPSRGSSVTVWLEIGSGGPIALTGSVVRVRTVSGGVELSVAFTHRHESSRTVQLLRRYIVALERRQLVQDQHRS